MSTAGLVFAESLAVQSAGSCDSCGHEAVELAVVRDEDAVLHFCRPCMGDDAQDPSLEWVGP